MADYDWGSSNDSEYSGEWEGLGDETMGNGTLGGGGFNTDYSTSFETPSWMQPQQSQFDPNAASGWGGATGWNLPEQQDQYQAPDMSGWSDQGRRPDGSYPVQQQGLMDQLRGMGGGLMDMFKGGQGSNSFLQDPNKWLQAAGSLKSLFSTQNSPLNAAVKYGAATEEKKRNEGMASDLQRIATQNSAAIDPFGSQRPIYQQQLAESTANPTNSAYGRALFDKMSQMQRRKDAAAGRRSNNAYGDSIMTPEFLKAMTERDKMTGSFAGAGISPQTSELMKLLTGSAGYANQGNSPYYSAAGSILQSNTTQVDKEAADARQQELLKALISGR